MASEQQAARVGPYLVQDVLGTGPHGHVYAALQQQMGLKCALKRLHQPMAGERPGEEFSRIARVVVALAHPTINNVSQMLLHARHVVIVSELVGGQSLAGVLAGRGPLHPREVISLARQVCIGLQYAHQRCVYHTSLHPGNVFLLGDGAIKLTDMAIAALYAQSVGARPQYQPQQEAFLAPEFLADGIIHPPSDIYSLGMVLYSALTGALSFSDRRGAQQAGRFAFLEVGAGPANGQPRALDLDHLPDGTPEVLRHAIASALCENPADRPGSVNEFAAILRGAPSAPIAPREPRSQRAIAQEPEAKTGPRSRVCLACKRPVSPAGRVCLACGLVQREAPEMGEAVSYFHDHARKLLAKHDLSGAERAYRRALQRDPDSGMLHNELADVLAVANRFEEAAREYRVALKINPADDDAWHDLGLCLNALHRRRDAAHALRRAIELTEREEVRLSARIHLGAIAAEEGRPEEAIGLWQEVLAEDPGLTAVRMSLASVLASLRRYDEAQEQLRSIIAAEPENLQARNLMARIRERSQLESQETDESYGVIDDLGGGSTYLGVGFRWPRWL